MLSVLRAVICLYVASGKVAAVDCTGGLYRRVLLLHIDRNSETRRTKACFKRVVNESSISVSSFAISPFGQVRSNRAIQGISHAYHTDHQ